MKTLTNFLDGALRSAGYVPHHQKGTEERSHNFKEKRRNVPHHGNQKREQKSGSANFKENGSDTLFSHSRTLESEEEQSGLV
jgi:hypothetical protein